MASDIVSSQKLSIRSDGLLFRRILAQMTYVITFPCIGVKDAGFEEAEQLYINPDECIDCGACEPACPVTAIFEESAVPQEWQRFIQINADYYKTK
jgi:NAD-dependent dihydropyrimidine dehydrogenase PreA subunit